MTPNRRHKSKMSEVKTTSNGRWPQHINRLSSGDQTRKKMLEMKTTLMEDDLKILKFEYLSNQWSDLPQILTLAQLRGTNKNQNTWNEEDHQ